MKTHTFVKEGTGWYIDLPEYIEQGGSHGDLAMVAGADSMLDILAEGRDSVIVTMDTKPFEGSDLIELVRHREDIGGGDYIMRTYKGEPINHGMWLCDVTLFVFGGLPERIYVRKETE